MISHPFGRTPMKQAQAAAAAQPARTPDPVFSGLARLAAGVCATPLASISIVGLGEAWVTPAAVLPPAAMPQRDPFADYAAQATGIFEVPDAAADDRFRDAERIVGTLAIRSCAGCALRSAGGDRLGTLSVYDTRVGALSPEQRVSLGLLAEQAVARAELLSRLAEMALLADAPPAPPPAASSAAPSLHPDADSAALRDHLRKAETMFRNTFDQAPIGIAHADRRGRLLRYNQAFCTMLGFDPGELTNKTIGDVTHGDDVARVAAELKRLWNGEIQVVDLEKRHIRKDASVHWVRITTALVRAGDGTPEYSVEFLRDISARKESAEELERVHKQLMIASRQAGMAEVATNVLHNVGNILNSVNISASLVTERVKTSKAPGVSRVAALLQEKGSAVGDFLANDERGRRLPEYLTSLGEQLMSDQKMALEELASLRDNLEHIKDTVAMQQSYAKLCGVTETVAVADLVEDSLRLNAGAFLRHGVTLRREFNEVPPITVDKHKVLQILVNLVRNAKYACDESGRSDKLLTLRIEGAPGGVRICVIDNGVGIPAENMSRLFTHGFTTRVDGHGFGLHSGALAAQELGGSLRVMSDGPGLGATFVLELPCGAAEAAHG
jgi:PAS domain S-box-containing protein